MWPFKERIYSLGELEDKLAGKKAMLAEIRRMFDCLDSISSYWIMKRAELGEEIGIIESRCERMKKEENNAKRI